MTDNKSKFIGFNFVQFQKKIVNFLEQMEVALIKIYLEITQKLYQVHQIFHLIC